LSDTWKTNLAFHYTKGKGYYEEFVDDWKYTNVYGVDDSQFSFIGLTPIIVDGVVITSTDYIRRKWLDNDFYGTTFSVNYTTEKLDLIIGGGYIRYEGDHFDQIIWAQYPSNSQSGDIYDSSFSTKNDGNFFVKANYQLLDKVSIYGDLQLRNVHYKTNGNETGLVNDTFNFFNPKAGITYQVNQANSLYLSYARAHREPNRSDYKNGSPKPEKLNDFELGWRNGNEKIRFNTNAYFMGYKDQLVLTGQLDNVGSPIRANSGDSYRLGLKIDAVFQLSKNWKNALGWTMHGKESSAGNSIVSECLHRFYLVLRGNAKDREKGRKEGYGAYFTHRHGRQNSDGAFLFKYLRFPEQ